MMHILQLTLAFPPCFAWGGPVKTVYNSCRELVRRRHEVTVYCSNLASKKEKLFPETVENEIDGIRVVYFKAWNIGYWPGTLGPVWLPDLPGRIQKEIRQFDVIHLNGYRNTMHLPVICSARENGIPYIVQPRGTMPVIVNSFFAKRLYDRFLGKYELEGLSALVALQESEVLQAIALGVDREKIHIIPNGLDLEDKKALPEKGRFIEKYQIPENSTIILFAARINTKKGTDMLVKAFARMDKGLDARLVIAGPDDGQLLEVRKLIRLYGLEDRVIVTGLLSHQEVLEAFVDADIFVLPCRTDTFPMAMVEACLTDTPMVITDRCEIAHLVKDRVAEVVPFDENDFSKAMERLITDKALYQAYKAKCVVTLEQVFSLRAVVDKVEDLYQKVTADKSTDHAKTRRREKKENH